MRQSGFTLLELIVVVIILGVIAAVAVPRLLSIPPQTVDQGLKKSLAAIRDAIESYMAKHVVLPGADGDPATFWKNLTPYLRRTEIPCPVGPAQNADIKMSSRTEAITGETEPTKGWHYNYETGQFIVNFTGMSSDGLTQYDQF